MNPARFLRDAFFITAGVSVLGDQVFFVRSAQPVLVFLGIFLLGCAPALHVDESPGGNPWIKLLFSMLGDSERKK